MPPPIRLRLAAPRKVKELTAAISLSSRPEGVSEEEALDFLRRTAARSGRGSVRARLRANLRFAHVALRNPDYGRFSSASRIRAGSPWFNLAALWKADFLYGDGSRSVTVFVDDLMTLRRLHSEHRQDKREAFNVGGGPTSAQLLEFLKAWKRDRRPINPEFALSVRATSLCSSRTSRRYGGSSAGLRRQARSKASPRCSIGSDRTANCSLKRGAGGLR